MSADTFVKIFGSLAVLGLLTAMLSFIAICVVAICYVAGIQL